LILILLMRISRTPLPADQGIGGVAAASDFLAESCLNHL
jgi:hypothetical protein